MQAASILLRFQTSYARGARVWFALGAVLWLGAAAAGLWALWRYDNTPGEAAHAPAAWPSPTLARATDRPTLVMLAHPRCTCTEASLGELAEVIARARTQP